MNIAAPYNQYKQPWIGSPITEVLFILLPPFICVGVIVLLPQFFENTKEIPLATWVILVLLIDVSHVYTTLYRTYFDKQALRRQKTVLWVIPFVCFVLGVLLYSISSLWFWRILAYIAVFHFIRQQYGFMRLYSRHEQKNSLSSWIDIVTIYAATLYPISFWHLSGPRNFNWFIDNDFIYAHSDKSLRFLTWLYWIIVSLYFINLIADYFKQRKLNIPKFSIVAGTLVSWYFGIVYSNGDMSFTLLNVVSHGIPYMALVWVFGRKTYGSQQKQNPFLYKIFNRRNAFAFLLIVSSLAFVEEFMWDIAVWKEHRSIFGGELFSEIIIEPWLLTFLVPLLSLPQVTHYVLDGFIWKIKKDDLKWSGEK